MKKNQGYPHKHHKDNPKFGKSQKNNKHLCLKCLKTFKSIGTCCGDQLFSISYVARAPKLDASKHNWKKFIQYFVHPRLSHEPQLRILYTKFDMCDKIKDLDKLVKIDNDEKSKQSLIDESRKLSFFKRYLEMPELSEFNKCGFEVSNHQIVPPSTISLNFERHKKYYIVFILGSKMYSEIDKEYRSFVYLPRNKKDIFGISECSVKPDNDGTISLVVPDKNVVVYPQSYNKNKHLMLQNRTVSFYVFDHLIDAQLFEYNYFFRILSDLKKSELGEYIVMVDYVNNLFDKIYKKHPEKLIG